MGDDSMNIQQLEIGSILKLQKHRYTVIGFKDKGLLVLGPFYNDGQIKSRMRILNFIELRTKFGDYKFEIDRY
jgi:hypothetical protein